MFTYELQKIYREKVSPIMDEFVKWLDRVGFRYVFEYDDQIYILFDQKIAGVWFPIRLLVSDEILMAGLRNRIRDDLYQLSINPMFRNSEIQANYKSYKTEWDDRTKNLQLVFDASPWEMSKN